MNTSMAPANAAMTSKPLSKSLQNPFLENFIYSLPQIPSPPLFPSGSASGSESLMARRETALGRRLKGGKGDYIICFLSANALLSVLISPTPHPHPFEYV